MKLRIYGPSLRFRFDSREVERLCLGETLESAVPFGPTPAPVLRYRVVPEARESGGLRVAFDTDSTAITVSAPLPALRAWKDGAELALTLEQRWGDGDGLKLILEKDMQRLNPKPEEESVHAYPNPQFGKAHCAHS